MQNKIYTIYKITNLINGKIYIGKTKNTIENRFLYGHVWSASKHSNKHIRLQNAIRKYGPENFKIESIDTCLYEDELNILEKYYIQIFNSRDPEIGYNMAKGGEGGIGGPMFYGHKHSDETKKHMSESRKGENNSNFGNHRTMPEEEKLKHGHPGKNNPMFGKHHSEETKNKIGLKNSNKIAYSNLELDKVKMIKEEEIPEYESKGWFKGNIHAKNFKLK